MDVQSISLLDIGFLRVRMPLVVPIHLSIEVFLVIDVIVGRLSLNCLLRQKRLRSCLTRYSLSDVSINRKPTSSVLTLRNSREPSPRTSPSQNQHQSMGMGIPHPCYPLYILSGCRSLFVRGSKIPCICKRCSLRRLVFFLVPPLDWQLFGGLCAVHTASVYYLYRIGNC